MSKQVSAVARVQRESDWRDRLKRQASSRQSVAAFCRSEGVSVATFYWWRSRLRGLDHATAGKTVVPARFLDLGTVQADPSPSLDQPAHRLGASLELRLDLGQGIVLHIARR